MRRASSSGRATIPPTALAKKSSVGCGSRLAGQWADAESGLHYNVGRYYAPFVGQYLSLDPRWLDHLDNHPYRYARSDPFGRHDPLGDIAPLIIAIGGAALIGGIVSGGITAWQGGSWRQIGASFAHGALSGAGMAVGAMLGGIPGLMVGAGAGGFLGSLAEQAINGEKLCFGCAAKEGLTEGLFAGLLGGLGKMLGRALANTALGRAVINSRIGQAISNALKKLEKQLKKTYIRIKRAILPPKVPPGYLNSLNKKVSQKQMRHIAGRPEYRGGGTMNSVSDAQKVLDAVHSGKAQYLGTNSSGGKVYRYTGVTGTNINVRSGIASQPTNVFVIKGTTSPSIVPIDPTWTH